MDNANVICYATPCNSKSVLAVVFGAMQQLANKEITPNEACAQAKLASQVCNLLNYELKRTVVQMKLDEVRGGLEHTARLREIESKVF